jgi:hypothetical protein
MHYSGTGQLDCLFFNLLSPISINSPTAWLRSQPNASIARVHVTQIKIHFFGTNCKLVITIDNGLKHCTSHKRQVIATDTNLTFSLCFVPCDRDMSYASSYISESEIHSSFLNA